MQLEFLQSLALLLIGLLFFKENILSWIGKKFGFSNGKDKIPDWARELKTHYNDDITQLLREIRDGQTSACKKIDKVITMLENQDKYGINIRR